MLDLQAYQSFLQAFRSKQWNIVNGYLQTNNFDAEDRKKLNKDLGSSLRSLLLDMLLVQKKDYPLIARLLGNEEFGNLEINKPTDLERAPFVVWAYTEGCIQCVEEFLKNDAIKLPLALSTPDLTRTAAPLVIASAGGSMHRVKDALLNNPNADILDLAVLAAKKYNRQDVLQELTNYSRSNPEIFRESASRNAAQQDKKTTSNLSNGQPSIEARPANIVTPKPNSTETSQVNNSRPDVNAGSAPRQLLESTANRPDKAVSSSLPVPAEPITPVVAKVLREKAKALPLQQPLPAEQLHTPVAPQINPIPVSQNKNTIISGSQPKESKALEFFSNKLSMHDAYILFFNNTVSTGPLEAYAKQFFSLCNKDKSFDFYLMNSTLKNLTFERFIKEANNVPQQHREPLKNLLNAMTTLLQTSGIDLTAIQAVNQARIHNASNPNAQSNPALNFS